MSVSLFQRTCDLIRVAQNARNLLSVNDPAGSSMTIDCLDHAIAKALQAAEEYLPVVGAGFLDEELKRARSSVKYKAGRNA